jgi:hypothetical protein
MQEKHQIPDPGPILREVRIFLTYEVCQNSSQHFTCWIAMSPCQQHLRQLCMFDFEQRTTSYNCLSSLLCARLCDIFAIEKSILLPSNYLTRVDPRLPLPRLIIMHEAAVNWHPIETRGSEPQDGEALTQAVVSHSDAREAMLSHKIGLLATPYAVEESHRHSISTVSAA